jgi:MoxR-like ATPase
VSSSAEPITEISFEALAAEASELRARIDRFRVALGRWFVGKQTIVDLMVVAAVAQEPLMLVGPPGTAKSDLVLKFKDALDIPATDYFEYMLTRFTEPSEIFGPIDVALLRKGRYVRRDQGKLPTARLVFLDEILKSNSAILNALLTVINERKFYQDGAPVPVRLEILFAATNDIPEHSELAALKDRFCLKVACRSVGDEHFLPLIDAGLELQTHRELGRKPWAEGHANIADFLKAHRYLAMLMGQREGARRDRDLYFREELLQELRRVLKTLVKEDSVFISDRKIVKIYRLLRTRAWLMHGGAVERDDLRLLAHLGDTPAEIDLLEEKVPRLLGLS